VLVLAACGDDAPPGGVSSDAVATARPPDAGPPDAPPPDAPTLPQGSPCSLDGGLACAAGLLCCAPCCQGEPSQCGGPAENDAGIGIHQCPLPDLTIDRDRLLRDVQLSDESYSPSSCEIQEGCILAPGNRRVLRFSVQTPNFGTADLALGDPSQNPLFVWSSCHNHYHFSGYALYQLLDRAGNEVTRGRKQAFCLVDVAHYASFPWGPASSVHDCGNQGISMGWSDIYSSDLPCQFIDVTGVAPGTYTLQVTINPERQLPELRYDNNTVSVPVTIP